MSKQNLWSQAAASLEKACEDEPLATKWKESFANLCKNQQNEIRIERLPARNAARLILHSLGRGHALIKQAGDWKEPIIGSSKKSSRINLARGIMWRYVISYCGWEQCTKSLNITQKSQDLILQSAGGMARPCLSKSQIERIERWLPAPIEIDRISKDQYSEISKISFSDFLGLQKQYKSFPYWLLKEEQGSILADSAILAIMRNICVRGSLSPSKAENWGMTGLFRNGTDLITVSHSHFISHLLSIVRQ